MRRLCSIFFLSIFIFNAALLFSYDLKRDAADFEPYQYTLTKEEVEEKICHMLQKESGITNWYNISEEALTIYASSEDKEKNLPEFTFYFGNRPRPKKEFPLFDNPYRPLKGLKVAIDPGHFGKDYARIEQKYVDFDPNENVGILNPIQFDEGTLATLTAKKLAGKLESLGASVLLTRTQPGETVYKQSYENWFEENFDQAVDKMIAFQANPIKQQEEKRWWLEKAKPTDIFRFTYVYVDLERRAELINTFDPHVTISCHYNLGAGYDKNGKTPGTDKDYTLFFVPGAFTNGNIKHEAFKQVSLKTPRSRYEFIRLLVTNDLNESIELAKTCLKFCQKKLKLPLGKLKNDPEVLPLKDAPGIFHRNLALPRLVHSPFIYPEPLFQDNYENAKSFDQNPDLIVNKMVDIYLKAILEWAEKKSLYG